jgi:hypothetical protein
MSKFEQPQKGQKEKIEEVVKSFYELHKDEIKGKYNALYADGEKGLAKLNELPPGTNVRYKISDENVEEHFTEPERWHTVTVEELKNIIEKKKVEISTEEYLKWLSDVVTQNVTDNPDYFERKSKFFMEGLEYDDFLAITDAVTPYSVPWSIVPEWTAEDNKK